MDKEKQRMQDLLDDTLAYYCVNPNKRRAVDPSSQLCIYPAIEGCSEGCAIGRHMTKEEQIAASSYGSIDSEEFPEQLIPKKLEGLPIAFLADIQQLHDNHVNWQSDGLSPTGQRVVDEIRKIWNLAAN